MFTLRTPVYEAFCQAMRMIFVEQVSKNVQERYPNAYAQRRTDENRVLIEELIAWAESSGLDEEEQTTEVVYAHYARMGEPGVLAELEEVMQSEQTQEEKMRFIRQKI